MNAIVPELDIDRVMLERYGVHVQPHGRRERRIVAELCQHLANAGWSPYAVWDGETQTKVSDAKAMMELVFNLDTAFAYFQNATGRKHYVMLVMGNDLDIVSDWSYARHGGDTFDAVMDDFDPYDFA